MTGDPRARLATALVLAAVLVVAGVLVGVRLGGSGHANKTTTQAAVVPVPRPKPPVCRPDQEYFEQAVNGLVRGCLRLPNMRPGPYTVAFEVGAELRGSSPTPLPTPAASAQIRLDPRSGPPGTMVTVHVNLLSEQELGPVDSMDVCWGGCPNGLRDTLLDVRLVAPHQFVGRTLVPQAPWVSGTRVQALANGPVTVGVRCLPGTEGCALGPAEGNTTFMVTGSTPGWCVNDQPCAHLVTSAAHAVPGQVVGVAGYAPLTELTNSKPFVSGTVPIEPGAPGAAVDVVKMRPDYAQLRLGGTLIDLRPAPAWSAMNFESPRTVSTDGLSPGMVVPPPAEVATCERSRIEVHTASGRHVRFLSLPTGMRAVRAGRNVLRVGNDCNAAVVEAGRSRSVFASFTASPPEGGPPTYQVGLYSVDSGHHWQLVPTARDASVEGFGGFRNARSSVIAEFTPRPANPQQATPGSFATPRALPAVATSDGGRTWAQTRVGCPAGACLSFGPFATNNCAKFPIDQPVLYSTDNGSNWRSPRWPASADACGTAQLATFNARDAVLVSSRSDYPVVRTQDGGRTWTDVQVPAVPVPAAARSGDSGVLNGRDGYLGGLWLLPTGALLAQVSNPRGYLLELLPAGGSAWCDPGYERVVGQGIGNYLDVQVFGGNLWLASQEHPQVVVRAAPSHC